MGVSQRKDGHWRVSYRDNNGKSRSKIFPKGRNGKKAATAFDAEIRQHKALDTPLPAHAQPRKEGIYLDELSQFWLNHQVAIGSTRRWLEEVKNLLENHLLPHLCHCPVNELTYDTIIRLIATKYGQRSQSTRNRYTRYLKSILNFGVEHGHCGKNPLLRWKRPKEQPRQTLLTVEDLKKIIESAAPHLKWGIEVAWNLGARTGESELLALRWEHVDWDNGEVRIFAVKTQTWRHVPMTEDFQARMYEMRQQSQSGYVIEYKGQPIKKFRRSFGTAARNAGITYDVRMYDIRHLFATVLLTGGADLQAVSKLMGHASVKMTADQYYHLQRGEKQRAVSMLPKLTERGKGRKVIKIGRS